MSIKDIGQKIKYRDVISILILTLICTACFGTYKLLATKSGGEVTIKSLDIPILAINTEEKVEGLLVASKSGKKYHFPTCSGAKRIAENNKIWFSSYEEAQKTGYTPAANCPGLK